MPARFNMLACLALTGALGFAAPALPQDLVAPCRLCGSAGPVVDDKPKEPVRLEVEAFFGHRPRVIRHVERFLAALLG